MAFACGRLGSGVQDRGPGARGGEKHIWLRVPESGKPGRTVLVMGLHQWEGEGGHADHLPEDISSVVMYVWILSVFFILKNTQRIEKYVPYLFTLERFLYFASVSARFLCI